MKNSTSWNRKVLCKLSSKTTRRRLRRAKILCSKASTRTTQPSMATHISVVAFLRTTSNLFHLERRRTRNLQISLLIFTLITAALIQIWPRSLYHLPLSPQLFVIIYQMHHPAQLPLFFVQTIPKLCYYVPACVPPVRPSVMPSRALILNKLGLKTIIRWSCDEPTLMDPLTVAIRG